MGKITDEFHVDKEIGRGAFSRVYRGKTKHPTNPKHVAVKVVRHDHFKPSDLARQLKVLDNEIKILETMNQKLPKHPALVELHGVVREEERVAIVMELLTGKELFDRIVERKHYSEVDAAQLMVHLITAIKDLHEHGILHRDLKPENLVYADSSEYAPCKITDFGLASVSGWADVHNSVVGTPGYVAPEVLTRCEYTEACDVWSMGVILYVLLVGYPPFWAESNAKLFALIKAGKFDFHPNEWKDISLEARDLVSKMLTVDTKHRITTEGVLSHPWIKNSTSDSATKRNASAGSGKNLVDTVKRLRTFNAKQKLRAAAMAVMVGTTFNLKSKLLAMVKESEANVFSIDELTKIRESFKKSASKVAGRVDLVEFKNVLKSLGFGKKLPLDRMFEVFDTAGTGSIAYRDFLATMSTLRRSGEDAIKFVFQVFDADDSGGITFNELAQTLQHSLNESSATQVSRQDSSSVDLLEYDDEYQTKLERLFSTLDVNNDGVVSFEEFKDGCEKEPRLLDLFLRPIRKLHD